MYEIIGVQPISFEKDGKVIEGTKLHLAYDNKYVEGKAVENVYVSKNILDSGCVLVGQHCEISYNKYGKVSHVEIIN